MKEPKRPYVGEELTVRPLSKCNLEGHPYRRLPATEQEIATALGLGVDELLSSAEKRGDETLVYLIRERRRKQDWATANKLLKVLLVRCHGIIVKTLGSLDEQIRDEAIRTVQEQLISQVVLLDDDRGDFYEIRFGLALKRLATTHFRECVKALKYQRSLECGLEDEEVDSRNAPFDADKWPEDAANLSDVLKVLEVIKDPRHRTAYILRKGYDVPIESEDPNMLTISGYFAKSPRTIQNWLDQAEFVLARWRGEMS